MWIIIIIFVLVVVAAIDRYKGVYRLVTAQIVGRRVSDEPRQGIEQFNLVIKEENGGEKSYDVSKEVYDLAIPGQYVDIQFIEGAILGTRYVSSVTIKKND